MYDSFSDFLKDKKHIAIIQAENPDGDSLGSALALDYLLKDHEITLYCPVDIPKYLRYFDDWSRVTNEFDFNADGYIIVDTAAEILLSKLLDDSAIKNRLERSPVFVLDHHETEDDLHFAHQGLVQTLPACCDLIYKIAIEQGFLSKDPAKLDEEDQKREEKACEYLYYGIMSDTLGMVSPAVSADTYELVADLLRRGVKVAELDEHRRDFMKKSPRILDYKADLIKRVQYYLDGKLATVHITWDLAQLNREVTGRDDPRPVLSDLRESGSIEQDADLVMMLHRVDYYHLNEDGYEPTHITELLIQKHRHGKTGKIELYFHPELLRFMSLDKRHE